MRLVFDDAGPLGLLASPRGRPLADRCRQWARDVVALWVRVFVSEIADYEVRRVITMIRKGWSGSGAGPSAAAAPGLYVRSPWWRWAWSSTTKLTPRFPVSHGFLERGGVVRLVGPHGPTHVEDTLEESRDRLRGPAIAPGHALEPARFSGYNWANPRNTTEKMR